MIDQGSEVYDAYRLSEINISVNGSLAQKYKLGYVMNDIGNKSLLYSITQFGADGVSTLPPVKFEYAVSNNGFNDSVNWDTPRTGRMDIRTVDKAINDTDGDTFDVNGDGLLDIVRFDPTQAVHDNWDVWLNTGSGFSGNQLTWNVPKGWSIRNNDQLKCTNLGDSENQDPNTKTVPMDINGDGYIDFLKADGNGSDLEFRINDGNNFSSTTNSWTLPFNAYIRDVRNPCDGDAPNVQQTFFDINGDGLPDIVKKEKVGDFWYWHIWRNNRNGFTDFGLWRVYQNVGEIEDFTRGTTTNTEVSHYDINGDGLVDIVIAYDSIWRIWLNTGSNFIDGGQWDTHNTSFDNINDTNNDGKVKRDFIDINGDGLPDIVNPVANVRDWEVWYNTGKGFTDKQAWYVPADVDQNGYITNLDDAGDTSRDVFDIDGDGAVDLIREFDGYWKVYSNKASQADLLAKITDTLGGTVTINYSSSMEFDNTRLPFNYWAVSSVETNNGMAGPHALVATTNYSYAQGLYDFPTREFRGFGTVTETRADGSKVNHYYHQDEAKKGKEYKAETKNTADVPFASVQNTFSEALSNGVYISNIAQTDEYTFDGTPDNPKVRRKGYQNYDSFGNVGLLIDYGDWNSGSDDVYTYNEYWPSCSSVYVVDRLRHKYIKPSAAGSTLREGFYWYDNSTSCVSKGNLTKEENWLNTGNNPVTLHEYDAYGNRTRTTDPEGRVTRFEFDSTYHTFPVNTYNAKNQLTTRSFNVVDGQVIQETDPNGFTSTLVYDTFQRKIREVKPYDSDQSPTVSIQYVMDGVPPESVIVYKKDGTPIFDTVQFIDGFGNLIQTKAEYESDINKIVVDVFYDKMGRVKKQSNPYLTDSTLAYSPPDVIAPGTGYTYDPLGRPIEIQNPDGTQISRTFDHWTVNETDENGHAKSYAFDASQRLKQVVENNSGSSYVTNYVYSPLGELTNITDHSGNVTTIAYDSLGRKIQMNDPDMSTWMYAYDRVGNLVSQTDARGITTNITYDPLNRKTFIDYLSSADIQFTYDAGTIGTLSQVVDAAGTVNYYYDQRLRKSREDRTIDGNTFSTLWAYDSMDRATSQTYPDGQSITFNYNAQGKLDNVPGIISGIDYNASGQVTQKNYANGKNTSYTYDTLHQRLKKILTSSIQNLSYTYDNVGNIVSIADGISGKTENFGYDDLDRLTGAGDGTYGIQYQYNPIGNMLSMTKDGKLTQFTYGAGAAIPHAVTGMNIPIPVVGSFVINKGDAYTTTNVVTLDNISAGNPTYYMASEDKTFAGAAWQTYSTAPSFLLSAGFGIKTVYFKVMNMESESSVKSDTIELRLNPEDVYKDDDEDGLSNYLEYIYGTNPNKKDTDADGISDYAEVFTGKSDPKNTDSDKDGINDLNDPYPKSAYHYSFSENYALRHTLNEGGDTRSSSTYKITDSLGNGFGKDFIYVQSHPALSVTPSLIDFKTVKIGDSSMVSITLSNSGMGDLAIENISFNTDFHRKYKRHNKT